MNKLKTYDQFYEEINIKSVIGAGLIGAAAIGSPAHAAQGNPPTKTESPAPGDTIAIEKQKSLIDTVEDICRERPEIVVDESELPTEETMLTREMMPSLEKLSYLEIEVLKRDSKVSLDDLDMLSKPGFPFRINYFYVRGMDTYGVPGQGPYLMPILNINYSGAKISGHEVMFNFTRITGVNTFGASINF